MAGPLFKIPRRYIMNLAILSILSGAWIWVTVFCIALPDTRPVIQIRILLAALVQGGLLLGNVIYDFISAIPLITQGSQHQPAHGHGD